MVNLRLGQVLCRGARDIRHTAIALGPFQCTESHISDDHNIVSIIIVSTPHDNLHVSLAWKLPGSVQAHDPESTVLYLDSLC